MYGQQYCVYQFLFSNVRVGVHTLFPVVVPHNVVSTK